jgi:adenylylsulfate kinase
LSTVVWFTGLPSSGKSTLARAVAEELRLKGQACVVLDGDDVRAALAPRPGYGDQERDDFYLTLAQLAALVSSQGVPVLVPATAHARRYRDRARALVTNFIEVFVDTPPATCAARDSKGLYAASELGSVSTLPGAGSAYEPPRSADIIATQSEDATAKVVHAVAASFER